MPIRLRLALVFALATAVLGIVAGIIFARQLRSSLDDNLDSLLRARSQSLTTTLTDATTTGAVQDVFSDRTDVAQLVADGSTVAASARAGRVPVLTTAELADAADRTVIVDVSPKLPHESGTEARVVKLRVIAVPTTRGVVLVGTERETLEDAVEETIGQAVVVGAIAVLLAAVGAYGLAGAALRPVERMRARAAELGVRNQPAELPVPGTRDELARLAVTLNDLLARMHLAWQQERAFVADAGHELRTPLAVLSAELELAARPGRTVEELVETVTVAREETDRLVRLAADLLVLARADTGTLLVPVETYLAEVVGAAAQAARAAFIRDGATLVVDDEGESGVRADADRLRQVVDNLLANALRYGAPGGTVHVTVGLGQGGADGDAARDPRTVRLVVRDSGPGFPEDLLPVVFERFSRGDQSRTRSAGGEGSGLGLAIVRSIVEAHGGTVEAGNPPGGGAQVTVVLPVDGPTPSVPPDDSRTTPGTA